MTKVTKNKYLDMEGDKHTDNIEASSKQFTVSITFECVNAKNPLYAAKTVAKWLVEDGGEGNAYHMAYDVNDEETRETYTVDLSEEDEDAVFPKK